MKSLTTKLALFAFLSSLSLTILPSELKRLEASFRNLTQKFDAAEAPCRQAIILAIRGENTEEYAYEKCKHYEELGLKALAAKKALDDAKKIQPTLWRWLRGK